jgi:carbon-monoxide dehydrogenase small subunit
LANLVQFYVNGNPVDAAVNPEDTLLETLRDHLGLTSPKCGCNHGDCGACTVILDGKAVKSCMVFASAMEGKSVLTVDGLTEDGRLHPVQQAFHEYGAPQCGFCTPGMVMATVAFLESFPNPTEEEIREALSGNLCRCGGYQKYVDAALAVVRGDFAEEGKGGGGHGV